MQARSYFVTLIIPPRFFMKDPCAVKSLNKSAAGQKRRQNDGRCVIPTGDCVVLHTQLMAGSHKTETVVTSHPSLLKAFVDGEMGTFDSFMIDFSLANQE